jgi:signal transduction histidine kinase
VQIHAIPLNRGGSVQAALVFRSHPWSQESAIAFAEEGARALSPTLGRQALLDRLEAQQTLLDAADRRVARVGFDLHDGPLQRVSALIADLAHQRRQLSIDDERLRERERLARSLDEQLRELISALPSTAAQRELGAVLSHQTRTFTRRSGVRVRFTVDGTPWPTTQSQRIALGRVVQEALANVRKHSDATLAEVSLTYGPSAITLQVTDKGRGFEAGAGFETVQDGRLGLLTMSERIQLLGGVFEIDSRPGGPTVVTAVVPRVEPFGAGPE